MTTPFYVDLFYEDVGFTNDYSNVLQFEDKASREAYFDNIAHYHMENTQFNNMNVEGNSVKIAFDNLQSVDFDEINYIRIATRLYGTETTIDTLEYGFIIDYEVIASAENCTVVEFTFEKDIWTNYQFNFTLKECNVERSHMDRWDENGNIIYTRPSYDGLDSYMTIKEKKNFDNKMKFYTLYNYRAGSIVMSAFKEIEEEIAYVFISAIIEVSGVDSLNTYVFPIRLTDDSYVHTETYDEYDSGAITAFRNGNTSKQFPTKAALNNGTLYNALGLNSETVVNIQVLYNCSLEFKSEGTLTNFTNRIYTMDGDSEVFMLNTSGNYAYYKLDTANMFKKEGVGRYIKDYTLDKDMPEMPSDGEDYSDEHEIMLYKSPVIKRYISNFDGSMYMEIPDIFINKDTIRITTLISNISVNNIITMDDEIAESAMVNGAMTIPALGGDLVSDAWKNYVMTYRDTDRELMWTNILTAGIADAGSTGISAGIGYRANQERAEMANIQRSMVDGRTKYGRSLKAESQMYSGFAKQAAGMSLVGGAVQFAANAYGTYMAQEIKEKAIKNTPGTLAKSGDATSYINANIDYNLFYIELKCDEQSYKTYADIFKKFGYGIYGVIQPNIKSRKYFNYIKTAGAILTGNVNQSILANLAVLFDKGMTIWHMDYTTRATLYDYTKENIERSLMTNE